MWRKQPGFVLLAVVTLALGIGAATAMISLERALFFSPLAVEDASRLVELNQTLSHRPELSAFPIALPDYWYYRDRARTVPELVAHYPTAPLHLVATGPAAGSQSAEIFGSVVTANYFSTLRLRPQVGRFFLSREDEVPDRDPVAVIGDDLWRRQFDADPRILGQTVALNGRAFTIVGVAPRGFLGALPGIPRSDVWIPTAMFRVGYRAGCDGFRADCRLVQLIGRLAPGVTVAAAQAEMDLLAGQLVAASPEIHKGRGIHVRLARGVRLTEQATHAPTARLLLAIVGCVLLMACANLAGLLLARNVVRRKEVAIRLALGAGRLRLLRQFLIESLVLALVGAAAGVLVAIWTNELLRASFGTTYVGTGTNFVVSLDAIVLGFTLALSIGTALAFGLVPAWAALRPDVAPVIKDEAVSGGSSRSRLRDALVIAQIAASLVLLAGAGLLARSLADVLRGPGVDIDRVVLLRLRPGQAGYGPREARTYQQEAVRRIEALPGVASAAVAEFPPLPGWGSTTTIARSGDAAAQPVATRFNHVGPRYFETLGVRVVDGRAFEDRDRPETPRVAIVNETLARRLWPRERAIGAALVVDGAPHEIVGVVQDAQYAHAGEPTEPMLYVSFWQLPPTHRLMGDSTTHVRVMGDAGTLLARIRQELAALDRDVPIGDWTLSMRVDDAFRRVRVAGTLATYAGALALFLSATGVYGLLSFAVNQRRREIAIRAALGAGRRDLARLVVRQTTRLAGIGVTVGLIGAIAAARLLIAMLYGVQPYDPLTLLTACAAIAAMAIAATWLPARRAVSVDPNIALRET
jgi:putative ABC transport system permease protein